MQVSEQQLKISVIVPTRNRAHLLPQLIKCFDEQTWSNKELLILDDTPAGEDKIKTLKARHPQISLWHVKQQQSIGFKRNQLIEHASGEVIAHFDDDDYYAPNYLEFMARELLKHGSDLVKLAGWFCFHEASRTLGYWDTTRTDLAHTVFAGSEPPKPHNKRFTAIGYRSFLTGYGFSYFYRKKIWEQNKFKDINLGEDTQFYEEIIKQRGKTNALQDATGVCIHIIHRNNTSRCFPNHILPNALAEKYIKKISILSTTRSPKNQASPRISGTQKSIQFCTTKANWTNSAPAISICTLTYNRHHFLPLLQNCIEKQDYPHSKIEWLILDDSENNFKNPHLTTNTKISIKYQRVKQKLCLGRKRNLSHQLCSGDYLIYMDDDDFYYPTRVSHAISSLQHSGKQIAGSTLLQIYFCHDQQLWLSGPFGQNHATANTFAMTKEFARSHHYNNEDTCNEEKYFLNNYTIPMQQLDPLQTMICISHSKNTFDKKRMRVKGEHQRLKRMRKAEKSIKSVTAGYWNIYTNQS